SIILLSSFFSSSFAVKCGQNIETNSGFRILGGKDASPGQVPWQTSLTIGSSHVCGGSVISRDWVLTAAHCLDDYANNTHVNRKYKYYVVAGSLIRRKGYKFGQRCEIEKMIFHPQYNRKNLMADIMLLKLKTPFEYRKSPHDNKNSSAIGPICLPDVNSKECNYKGVTKVSGFGLTKHKGNASHTLRFIHEKVVDDELCEKRFAKVEYHSKFQNNITTTVVPRIGRHVLISEVPLGSLCSKGIRHVGQLIDNRAIQTTTRLNK
ncbi:transmembrane protease serine 2-like protein, partial [Leptotrombidium deliense]